MTIKKVSAKLSKANSEYSKIRKVYLTQHPVCHAKIYKCSLHATDVHHKKGRGKYHLDTTTWLPVCRNCHTWITDNHNDSIELGFSISRIE
jgi:hypothetical protein